MNLREELQKDPIIRKSRQNWLDGIVDPVLDEQAAERERALFTYYHGLAHARKEGLEEGKAEGLAEGRAEAHEKTLETARRLLRMGLSLKQIAQATGLPESEIEAL